MPQALVQIPERALTTEPPDIIEFVTSDRFLGRSIYPRQATLLKVIFLQTELFTSYDYAVLEEWATGEFKLPPPDNWDPEKPYRYIGEWGIQPDILERIDINRADGRKWFREVLAVIGRRGSKGYLGALSGSYVFWHYLCKVDPQAAYAIDRDKRLAALVFAGKKGQAIQNQWRDLVNVLIAAPCFQPYISQSLAESLTMHSKASLTRGAELAAQGVKTTMDLASFEVLPKEATTMAGRGPASFLIYFDEMAHVVATGASRGADELYTSATPSLDQFGTDGFIYAGSSPWQMIGQFYELCQQALEVEFGTHEPVHPDKLLIQLASWDIYKDWERAHKIMRVPATDRAYTFLGGDRPNPVQNPSLGFHYIFNQEMQPIRAKTFDPIARPIQTYDAQMKRLERANPETFAVERRCLDPETRVLGADLVWRPIKDLLPGDELVAVDEYGESGDHPNHPKQRKMRTATVTAKWTNVDKAYRLTFDDGSQVTCSGSHRWLSAPASSPASFYWRSLFADPHTPGPRQGIKVGDTIRFLVEPWEEDRSWEAGYLAGVYDGEGTAIGYPRREFRVSFVQNPGEVLDATLGYLKEKGFEPIHIPSVKSPRRTQTYVINGFSNVMRFVGQLGAHKLRRQAIPGMWEGRGIGRHNGRSSAKTIVSIEELPEQELVDIETTTGTFIAEGLVSHNSKWAAAIDTYLNPVLVDRAFEPWQGRHLSMQAKGVLARNYVAHGDPSKSGANFGWAIAHAEGPDENGLQHVVFDRVHFWAPWSFEDGLIDYLAVEEEIATDLANFMPSLVTFDQFSSGPIMAQIRAKVSRRRLPKRITIDERTATAPMNWRVAETFKTALGLNLIHMPYLEQAELEMKFLQVKGQKVDHPTVGPVQTKDVFDAISNCVFSLIGDQMEAFLGAFSEVSVRPAGEQSGMGSVGSADARHDRDVLEALSSSLRRSKAADAAFQRGRPRGW